MKKCISILTLLFCLCTSLYAESYTINVGQSKVINCTASIPYSDNGVIHANFKLVDSGDNTYLSVSQSGSTWCTVYGYYPKEDIQIKVTCDYTIDRMPKEYYYYIYVTVNGVKPTSLSMDQSQYAMRVKETKTLSVNVSPSNADTYCRWSIESGYGNPSNFEITQSNSGLNNSVSIYAKAAGKCRVVVKTLNNLTASCIVEAKDIEATSITLNYSSLTLQKGDSYKIKATLTPSNATSEVTWKSSSTSVAKVSSGTITAVASGSATITATTSNGLSATCSVRVIAQAVEYEYSQSTATVSWCDNDLLTDGALVIPATTKSGSKTYNVTVIGENAFYNCTNLEKVIISSGIKTIEDNAFEGCSSLMSVEMPNSVTTFGEDVFKECSSLTHPVYNSSLFMYMSAYGTYSQQYEIPAGIKQICYAAFAENKSVKTVTIPSSVTEIKDKAFNRSKVNKVICMAQNPPSCNDYSYSTTSKEFLECFDNTQYYGTLVVPTGKKSLYSIADVWSNFINITEGTGSGSTSSLPADGSILTCSDAAYYASQLDHNSPTTQTYTIYGYITETDGVVSRNQQTFWMADTKSGGKVFEIYWGNVSEQLKVGDYVKCKGHLMHFYETSEMKNADVTLVSRSQSEKVTYTPNWVEIRYYPSYGFHSLDLFVVNSSDAVQELVRMVFKPKEMHRVNGSYSSSAGNILINKDIDGYYVASSSTWYDLSSAAFTITHRRTKSNGDKVYYIKGYCILTNGKEMDFTFEDVVLQSSVNTDGSPWQYSDFPLYDAIDEVEDGLGEKGSNKIIKDGQIYILRGNKVYTVTGQEVK